jgi:asparagine synthase (glutamine-hydrolysing)
LRRLDDTLTSAVKERTASSGRTAIFLSGGKDSSSLCIAASKLDLRKYLAVTVGFDDASVDESADAADVAQHLGIEHVVLKFSADEYAGALADYVRVHGQPFGDPAGLAMYLALKHFPADVEAILDGTGDDAYMGIPLDPVEAIYLRMPFFRRIARAAPEGVLRLLPKRIARGIGRFRKSREERFVSWNGWPESEILARFGLDAALAGTEMSRLSKSPEADEGVEFKTRAICRIWEPEAAYRKSAQPANQLGIPIGFPLADARLVALFSVLPKSLCFQGCTNKVLLREYMARHLPSNIVGKPKGSFEFDTDRFLRDENHLVLRRYLLDGASGCCRHAGLAGADPIVRSYMRGNPALSCRVFALVLLSVWLEQHPAGRLCL